MFGVAESLNTTRRRRASQFGGAQLRAGEGGAREGGWVRSSRHVDRAWADLNDRTADIRRDGGGNGGWQPSRREN